MRSDKQKIIKFLAHHRRRYISASVLNDVAALVLISSLVTIVLALSFGVFPWTVLPIIFDLVIAALFISILAAILKKAVFGKPSLKSVASLLEQRTGRSHQNLVVGLELCTEKHDGSPELISSAIHHSAENLQLYPRNLSGLFNFRRLFLSGASALICLFLIAAGKPSLLSYWDIPLHMFKGIEAQTYPGSKVLPSLSRVEFLCIPEVSRYPSAILSLKDLETGYRRTHLLRPDPKGAFSFVIDSLRNSYEYSFSLGGNSLQTDTLTVIDPPSLFSLRVTLEPPSYTGRKRVQLQEGQGAFTTYAGTKAYFSISSHHSLSDARLYFDWGDSVNLSIDSGKARGRMQLWRDGSYTFSLKDSLGQTNDSLPGYAIEIIPDQQPDVRIIKPGADKALAPAQVESVWVECVDDIGIGELSLNWKRSGTGERGRKTLTKNRRQTVVQKEVLWNLSELTLYPGDTIYYWAHVTDNRPWKPQSATSDTFWFRVPSFSEIHRQVARRESQTEQTLGGVQKNQEEVQNRLEQLIKSAKGKEKLSWEEKKIVEDIGKSMQSQVDSLDKAVQDMRQTIEELKEQGVLTEDLAEKIEKVRESVKDLVEQYGDSLLFQSPDPEDDVSWKELQQTVEKMSKMLPELQENLDNTLQYLETISKDMELAKLSARSEQLSQEQLRMVEQPDSSLARNRQESLNKDVDDLLSDISKMSDSSSRVNSLEEVNRAMAKVQRQMQSSTMPDKSSMAALSGALQSMSQELSSMMSSAMAAQMMEDRNRLISMAGDALDMSQWQSSVEKSTGRRSQRQLTAAQQQAMKDALRGMEKKVDSLGATPPQMLQPILRRMQQAEEAMENALKGMESGRSSPSMQKSAGALNSLANTLMAGADAMQQQMQGGGSGGSQSGLMPSLRQLTGKQAAINSATGEMLRQMLQGGRKESGMGGQQQGSEGEQASEQARRQARKAQQELADQLKELAEEYGKQSGGDAGKRLNELEQEARRLAKMLENPSRELRDRQENFLVRMLQSTLSMHKQGEGKEKRESTSSKEVFSTRNIESNKRSGFDDIDQFYRLRNRAMQSNFPESYRGEIQAYFDSLGVLYLKD